ncbi:hypothetical protein AGLY_014435 [Aphis glycines]|uniref:Uncharacterized protein n=1 Tax=Aphis glycines TaxID=307491 RepID=A0A6G0T5K0_APHGL|nr:hypothetical protein AGLY_014435 [Aphis glycines]
MKNILSPGDINMKLGDVKVFTLTLVNHISNVPIRNPLIHRPETPTVPAGPCWSVYVHMLFPRFCVNPYNKVRQSYTDDFLSSHKRACDNAVTYSFYIINSVPNKCPQFRKNIFPNCYFLISWYPLFFIKQCCYEGLDNDLIIYTFVSSTIHRDFFSDPPLILDKFCLQFLSTCQVHRSLCSTGSIVTTQAFSLDRIDKQNVTEQPDPNSSTVITLYN